ncbi:MAG: hypothetical protein KIT83_11250 [Bryobacterales bacterium]|nr:hypothetical protein [Bryobacterales bacterium]
MAMLNISSISAATTRMLGNDLGGPVASGLSNLLESGGQESLIAALSQLEKFFGPEAKTKLGTGPLATSPQAFHVSGAANAASSGLTNPFGVAQGLQPKMNGLIDGLNQAAGGIMEQLEALGVPGQLGNGTNAQLAKDFEATIDQAIKLHLSGSAADGLQAQVLFQKALGMISGGAESTISNGLASGSGRGIVSSAAAGGGAMPTGGIRMSSGGIGSTGGGSFAPAPAGGSPGGGVGGSSVPAMGGGLDAMMAQAESLMRSDSMESQLAGQRLMSKALRMFELISKLIEKQSEMASKAIAAIK